MKKRLIDLPKKLFKLSFLEKVLVRLTQQKPVGHFYSRLPPINTLYPQPTFRTVERNGIHYELDLSDYMEWLVFWGIQVEPRKTLYQLVKSGSTVIDVGANIGEVTMNFAQLVGPTGVVHAFEPNIVTFQKLGRNLALNKFTNIRINSLGIGDCEEELVLRAQVPSNRGGSRVHRHLSRGQNMQVITLDSYIEVQKVRTVSLIKIDVEGFELHVLRGAVNSMRQFKPTLFIEVDDKNLRDQGDSASLLVRFLEQAGYASILNAESSEPVSSEMNFEACHFDVIAR